MPIYEYRCDACGCELEQIQKFSDPALIDCPKCGEPKLKKLISASGFQLKGTGWYATDFKTGSGKNKDTEKNKDSEKSAEKKEKPAEKTEKGAAAGTDTKKTGDSSGGSTGSTD